jgi:ABC-type transport system substrate-binding protein
MDGIDRPIMPEYATQLAHFKAGNMYFLAVRAEDLLPTKRDIADLELMQADLNTATTRFFFGHLPESPFKDTRVRQAFVLTWDRDLYLDVIYNVSQFRAEGLPMETVWEAALQASSWGGWWIDPNSKEFGPNVKYFKQDVAEAKKLLAAAGFPNGVDSEVHFPASGIPTRFYNEYPPLIGMAEGSGLFRLKLDPVNYNADWTPKYRNIKGKFVGAGTWTPNLGTDDPTNQLYSLYNSNGALYQGGDQMLDDLTNKMLKEFDTKKRQALAHDVQRHEAEQWFYTRNGAASSFQLSWPVLRNQLVWQGGTSRTDATLFLDPERAPLKRA